MTRSKLPPRLAPARAQIDPVVEGDRHGLPAEVARSIWAQACAEATDAHGRCDEDRARRRFREHAAARAVQDSSIAIGIGIGKVTLVTVEAARRTGVVVCHDLPPRIPGRQTLVIAEEQRRRDQRARAGYAERGERTTGRMNASTILRSPGTALELDAEHPAVVEAVARRGTGAALPHALRVEMEDHLGADLREVRVHDDALAAEAARAIGARAFTIGTDIFFAPGRFDGHGAEGRALLAHELTHVVQAQHGRVPQAAHGELRVVAPGDTMELEADAAAARLAAVDRAGASGAGRAGGASSHATTHDGRWVTRAFAAQPARTGTSMAQPARPRSAASAVQPARPLTGAFAAQPARTLLRVPDPTTTSSRVDALHVPPGGAPVNELGVVAWDGQPALRLRSSPSTTANNVISALPFNTRVQVIQRFPGDWLLVATLDGRMGFCARPHVWLAPEHRPPEPNAYLHKVEAGARGDAIHVTRRYFGEVANRWGCDLRFFVNVLGRVNHVEVPDGAAGWKTVRFQAHTYIWIPSVEFARSLRGAVSSGSPSYEGASALGIAGLLSRIGELMDDFQAAIRLSHKYIPAALARHVEASVASVLESLLWMAVGASAVMAISTAIGAALGALGGGVGAAPGAAAGFEVGLALLEWLGLGFLAAWVGKSVARVGTAFARFFAAVWRARSDQATLEAAAKVFAEAIGTLAGVLVEALVMWAMSVGSKAAVRELAATPLGRAIGESRLGEWLERRIQRHQAGASPLPGPREALRRLLELRRRGERGGGDAKPALLADAWSELAGRHGLDDVVTQILRELQVDPAAAGRLLTQGFDPFELGELALDFGADGVRAADVMVQGNVQRPLVRRVLEFAREIDMQAQVLKLINSGRLENLPGLRNFLRSVGAELAQRQRGKLHQLMEAHERAMRGDRVSLEGRRAMPGDRESGQADVVDYTQRQAIQMKTVTTEKLAGVIKNLQVAIDQLAGERGEHPPLGFQRIAELRLEGDHTPLRGANRAEIVSALRGTFAGLDALVPPDTTPGLVRITNAISTFIFTVDELR